MQKVFKGTVITLLETFLHMPSPLLFETWLCNLTLPKLCFISQSRKLLRFYVALSYHAFDSKTQLNRNWGNHVATSLPFCQSSLFYSAISMVFAIPLHLKPEVEPYFALDLNLKVVTIYPFLKTQSYQCKQQQ